MVVVLDFESITKGHQGLFSTGRGVRALDGFLLRGESGRGFRILGPERRAEEYSPYSSRVGFSGARCCGKLNME